MVIVYGLCDPITADLFYVGLTRRHWSVRLSDHRRDPASAAYHRIQALRAVGEEPICVVLRRFEELEAARVFERKLIILIDETLENREQRLPLTDIRTFTPFDYAVEPFDDGWGTIETMPPEETS